MSTASYHKPFAQPLRVQTLALVKPLLYLLLIFNLSACSWFDSNNNEGAEAEIVTPVSDPETPAPEPEPPTPPEPEVTSISVLVIDENFQAISDATVTLSNLTSSLTANSNQTGKASFEIDYANFDLPAQLISDKTGYSRQVKIIDDFVADTQNSYQLTMLKRQTAIVFNHDQTLDLVTLDGARLLLSANSLVDENNDPVTGDVSVSITPLNTSQENALDLFPGEFLGSKLNMDPAPILSYGTTEFHFEQNGQVLDLAEGRFAQIELPIYADQHPDGSPVNIGDNIDLWFLDEDTGIWQNAQSGRVDFSNRSPTGLALRASVPHFSWWNVDVAPQTTRVRFNLMGDFEGECRIEVSALAGNLRTPRSRVTRLISNTETATYVVPINTPISFTASLNANGQAYFGSVGLIAQADTGQVDINLAPTGASNIPTPFIVEQRASVKALFTLDGSDNTFIHDANQINYNWVVLAGKPNQSGCANGDNNNEPSDFTVRLQSDAKRYQDVELTDSSVSLVLLVDPTETIDQNNQLIARDPNPITINLVATNTNGQTTEQLQVPNEANATPQIIRVNHFSDDLDQSLNFTWQVEGADDANIEFWVGNDIDLSTPGFRVTFNPNEEEIVNLGIPNASLGVYIRVSFINQYGTSFRDFTLGSVPCNANSDLPECAA